eukprot:TRINITY_DN10109_c0_g1_i1.p1 TRINITY_DN10109_c0_g1~~TRINITY_DN10109_c0_g1_i1.p1  ORF type:complete len:83 (-),score=21.92 TRINITY_DN10109_c0_g1_i1:45-293(-)
MEDWNDSTEGDDERDSVALMRLKQVLEKKNKALERELEEAKKSLHIAKQASIQEAARQKQAHESLQRELEDYKLMVSKSKVS